MVNLQVVGIGDFLDHLSEPIPSLVLVTVKVSAWAGFAISVRFKAISAASVTNALK